MKILLWKEAREQSSLVLAFIAICWGLRAFLWALTPESDQARLAVQLALVAMPILGLVLGGGAIAREYDHRTMALLLTRPIPRRSIWLAKLIAVGTGMAVGLLALLPMLFADPVARPYRGMLLTVGSLVALSTSSALACSFFTRNSVRASVLGALLAVIVAIALGFGLPDGSLAAEWLVSIALVAACGRVMVRADLFDLRSKARVALQSLVLAAPLMLGGHYANVWLSAVHPYATSVQSTRAVPATGLIVEERLNTPWLDTRMVGGPLVVRATKGDWVGPHDIDGQPVRLLGVSPDGRRWLVSRGRTEWGPSSTLELSLWSEGAGWRTVQRRPVGGRAGYCGGIWSSRPERFVFVTDGAIRALRFGYETPYAVWLVDGEAAPVEICEGMRPSNLSGPHLAWSPDASELWIARPDGPEVLSRYDVVSRRFVPARRELLAFVRDVSAAPPPPGSPGELIRLLCSTASGELIAEARPSHNRRSSLHAARLSGGGWRPLLPEINSWQLVGPDRRRLIAQGEAPDGRVMLISRDLVTGATAEAEVNTAAEALGSPDGRHLLIEAQSVDRPLRLVRSGAPLADAVPRETTVMVLDAATLAPVLLRRDIEVYPTAAEEERGVTLRAQMEWIAPDTLAILEPAARCAPRAGGWRLLRLDGTESRL